MPEGSHFSFEAVCSSFLSAGSGDVFFPTCLSSLSKSPSASTLSNVTLSGNPSVTLLFHSGLSSFYNLRASKTRYTGFVNEVFGTVSCTALLKYLVVMTQDSEQLLRLPFFCDSLSRLPSGLCCNRLGSSSWAHPLPFWRAGG